jgi:hypothetical protein
LRRYQRDSEAGATFTPFDASSLASSGMVMSGFSDKGDEKRFEYLSFQYKGREARFRDKTVSGFYRKLKWSLYAEVREMVRKYPGKSDKFIEAKLDTSQIMQKFGRKKGFADCNDVREWTFWTYVNRSTEIMWSLGPSLYRQISNYKRFLRHHLMAALVDQFVP